MSINPPLLSPTKSHVIDERPLTIPFTPEQNEVAKRNNQIMVEATRFMFYTHLDSPHFLWAEAMNITIHVINWMGPPKIKGKTP